MSGIILFLLCIIGFSFFASKVSINTKIISILSLSFFSLLFYSVSPENIEYSITTIQKSVEIAPTRKIISFVETWDFIAKSDFLKQLFGNGGGTFSSRTAFLVAGDYVDWYPTKYIWHSNDFYQNHFQLWNYEVLKIPYNDGTANQPFSVYNQFFGEYGYIGILLLIYYMSRYFKRDLLLGALLASYFLLDYWFEYLSVIPVFELLLIDSNNEK